MKLNDYKEYLINFLEDYANDHDFNGYVFGLSGGVDSAVVAGLLSKTNKKVLALIMPIESNNQDVRDAVSVAKSFNIDYKIIDLNEVYRECLKVINSSNLLVLSNIKPRLRMVALYAYAQENNLLVCGTDNFDEYYTGYFTKFGDGAYDILPLRYLVKNEIFELAKLLNVPDAIINKTPSAGLYNGQTDENEMGFSYEELDNYLLGKDVNEETKNSIQVLHSKTEHKRNSAILPEKYNRK